MTYSRILYAAADRRATITLNRPDKRNAFDDIMVGELSSAISGAVRDPTVKVIVLRAQGTTFCAGADIEYMTRLAAYDLEENRTDSLRLATLLRMMYESRKPLVAAVNGPALAGGCGLITVCDFVVASRECATFGYPEVRIGFVPAVVLPFLIKRAGEGHARELIIRGNLIDAQMAKEIGLVTTVVADADLDRATDELVSDLLTGCSGTAIGLCKEMLSKLNGLNLADSLEFAANVNAAARMTEDCKAGMGAFLRKEKSRW